MQARCRIEVVERDSYLESRFGSPTEYAHACIGEFEPTRIGEPFVIAT